MCFDISLISHEFVIWKILQVPAATIHHQNFIWITKIAVV